MEKNDNGPIDLSIPYFGEELVGEVDAAIEAGVSLNAIENLAYYSNAAELLQQATQRALYWRESTKAFSELVEFALDTPEDNLTRGEFIKHARRHDRIPRYLVKNLLATHYPDKSSFQKNLHQAKQHVHWIVPIRKTRTKRKRQERDHAFLQAEAIYKANKQTPRSQGQSLYDIGGIAIDKLLPPGKAKALQSKFPHQHHTQFIAALDSTRLGEQILDFSPFNEVLEPQEGTTPLRLIVIKNNQLLIDKKRLVLGMNALTILNVLLLLKGLPVNNRALSETGLSRPDITEGLRLLKEGLNRGDDESRHGIRTTTVRNQTVYFANAALSITDTRRNKQQRRLFKEFS